MTRDDSPEIFGPAVGGGGGGATLCELNGVLLSADLGQADGSGPLHVALPLASDSTAGGGAGYGFELPQLLGKLHETPGRRSRYAASVPTGAPSGPVSFSAAAAIASSVVTKLQEGIERGIKRGLGQEPEFRTSKEPVKSRPFSWQCSTASLLPASQSTQSTQGGRELFAATQLDHSVVIYDLRLREWSSHKLVHTQQRGVESLAWQPQDAPVLAVGCVKGVCIWRLTFSASTGELTGGHMLRLLEAGGHSPIRSLCWHPRGKWIASGSIMQDAVRVWDPSDQTSGTALWMKGGGVSLVDVSPCGVLLLGAGGESGLRVWETKGWTWESWRRFTTPCVAAVWSGPPPLAAVGARTLLIALQGQAAVVRWVGFKPTRPQPCKPEPSPQFPPRSAYLAYSLDLADWAQIPPVWFWLIGHESHPS